MLFIIPGPQAPFELLTENTFQLGLLPDEAGLVNGLEDLSNFGERVTVFGHVLSVVKRVFDFEVGLAKFCGAFSEAELGLFGVSTTSI